MSSMKKSNKLVVGVLGLPINKQKQFFLTRRDKPGKSAWHNKWQVAGGGLEFGEKPEDTLIREMKEELKVDIKIVHPQPILKSQIWYGAESDHERDTQIILATYIIDIYDQVPKAEEDEETNAGGWFSYEQSLELPALPLTPIILKEAYEMCNKYSLWTMLQ